MLHLITKLFKLNWLNYVDQCLQATKSSLTENEKREKRAMERKISEMEEELKVTLNCLS